jgi:hypothetical protein
VTVLIGYCLTVYGRRVVCKCLRCMYGTQGAVMQAIFSEEFSDEQTTAAFSASTVRPSGSMPASTMKKTQPVSPFAVTLGDSSSLLWFGVCGLPCGQVLGMTGSSVMFAIG